MAGPLFAQPPALGQVLDGILPACRLNSSSEFVTCKVRAIGTADGATIVYAHPAPTYFATTRSLDEPADLVRRTLGEDWVGRAALVEQLWAGGEPFSFAVIVLDRAGNPAWNYLSPQETARVCGISLDALTLTG
jgi:hypothetical protein